jgi:hypothetical protein
MRAECQFAKAGQGLFYNGFLIDNRGHTFSFVYDCGTSDAKRILSNSVQEYKQYIEKRLDILFVSHLHDDHVSHIPRLINDLELDCVVLPNILPEIRVLLASRIRGIETNHELISFYTDPARYFAERGAKRIFVLSNDNDNDRSFFLNDYEPQYVDDQSENSEYHSKIYFYSRYGAMQCMKLFDAAIGEYKGTAYFSIPDYAWEFRAINIHHQMYDDDFLDEVRKLLVENEGDIGRLLRDSKQIKNLRKIYENHFRNGKRSLNETSVIVRSRPKHGGFVIGDNKFCCAYLNHANECRHFLDEFGHGETLLLGDITVDFKGTYASLCRHFDSLNYLPRVIQLPHHGAKMRFHPMFYEFFDRILCHGCTDFVASYGLKNHYGHPNFCCEYPDFRMCSELRLVNERKDFSYTVMMPEHK